MFSKDWKHEKALCNFKAEFPISIGGVKYYLIFHLNLSMIPLIQWLLGDISLTHNVSADGGLSSVIMLKQKSVLSTFRKKNLMNKMKKENAETGFPLVFKASNRHLFFKAVLQVTVNY